MSGVFQTLMRKAPAILLWVALLVYVTDVVTILAEGREMSGFTQDMTSPIVKLRSVVLTFIKPLEAPMILFFGAALLWRLDRNREPGAAA